MMVLTRARQVLVLTALGAVVIVALEFPFHELTAQRGAIGKTAAALRTLQAENAGLRASIASLRRPSTIAAIAHREYGLARPNQRSYVILPAVGSTSGRAGAPLSGIDLGGATSSGLELAPAHPATAPSASLWRRFVDRLEFWR